MAWAVVDIFKTLHTLLTNLAASAKAAPADSRGKEKARGPSSSSAAGGGQSSAGGRITAIGASFTNAVAYKSVLDACEYLGATSEMAAAALRSVHQSVGDLPLELAGWSAGDLRSATLMFHTRVAELLSTGGDEAAVIFLLDAWQKTFSNAQVEGQPVTVAVLQMAIQESRVQSIAGGSGYGYGPVRGGRGPGAGGRGRGSPYGAPPFGRGRGGGAGQRTGVCYNSRDYNVCNTPNCRFLDCVGPGAALAVLPDAPARR